MLTHLCTLRLSPYLSNCKWCCCEYWSACIFSSYYFHFLWKFPEVQFLDHMVVLFLNIWVTSVVFSIVASPISMLALVISHLFDYSHSNSCEVISHCGFDLHFPEYLWCWAPFYVPVGNLCVFGKMSIQIFCPFFNQIVCFLAVELYDQESFYVLPFGCDTFP